MNYRHAFHAGNFADVVKHVALALCFDRLNAKDKPYRFIDTHAGIGLYDLLGEEGMRSPEWRDGVARVWCGLDPAPDAVKLALAPYLDVLRALNPDGKLRFYPGSPAIARRLMRRGDAIRLCELHDQSFDLLSEAMERDNRIKIEQRDGFEALPAFLPPPERRGLVLIDPPFEEGTATRKLDFERMVDAARKAVRRWPGGTYVFWRPLKDLGQVEEFDDGLGRMLIEEGGLSPEKLLVADLWVKPIGPGPLGGAGVMIANPPFGLAEHLRTVLPWLANLMDLTPDEVEQSGAGWRVVTGDPA
jgi:23S rRNA (adenine2030-N6)-methyltransferase